MELLYLVVYCVEMSLNCTILASTFENFPGCVCVLLEPPGSYMLHMLEVATSPPQR